MMPSRRAVLVSLASLTVGGCVGGGSTPSTDEPTATPTGGERLVSTEPAAVPTDATVGLLPEAMSELRDAVPAATDTHAPVYGDHWETLAGFECFAVDETALTIRVNGGTDAKEVLLLDEADGGPCVTVRELDLSAEHRDALETAHSSDASPTVPAATAQALREESLGYVIVEDSCYAVPTTETSPTPD